MRRRPMEMPRSPSPAAAAALSGVAVWLWGGLVHAAHPKPECTGAELDVDAETVAAHPTLRPRIAPRLVGADPCARVRVLSAGGALVVVVTLQDGRTALRKVADEDEAIDAVDALVTIPLAPTVSATAPPPVVSPPLTPVGGPPADAPVPSTGSTTTTPKSRLELGVGATVGIAGWPGFAGFGVAGLAQLHVAPHLVGVVVHFDPLGGPLADTDSRGRYRASSMSVAALFGRRFRAGGLELDLLGGLGLWAMNQEFKPPGQKEVRALRLDPRLVLSGRVSQEGEGSVRGYLAVDLTAGWPSGEAPGDGLVAFPSSSATLALGLSWRGL